MTVDWNSSSEFKNGHRRSNATPPPNVSDPWKIQTPPILMKLKPYALATK